MNRASVTLLAFLLAACGDDGDTALDDGAAGSDGSGGASDGPGETSTDGGETGSESGSGGGSGGMVDPPACLESTPTMVPTCGLLHIDVSMLAPCTDVGAGLAVENAVVTWSPDGSAPDEPVLACEPSTHVVSAGEYYVDGVAWEVTYEDVRWRCEAFSYGDVFMQNGSEETVSVAPTMPGGWDPVVELEIDGIDRSCCVASGSPTNPDYVTAPC